jgi:hypothetical protein
VGRKLDQLIRSLPTALTRVRLAFPLIEQARCFALGPHVNANAEAEDLRRLLNAVAGDVRRSAQRPVPNGEPDNDQAQSPASDTDLAVVDTTLQAIGADALTRRIRRPIDAALASCPLQQVTCDDHGTFLDIITGVYQHFVRHTSVDGEAADPQWLSAEAIELVENAFRHEDGLRGAEAEARHGPRGGLRFVVQRMAEQLKQQRELSHVNRVLKEVIDPLSPHQRINFMRALMQRIGHHVPADVRQQPPEYFASEHERFARAYVQAVDGLTASFRSLIG